MSNSKFKLEEKTVTSKGGSKLNYIFIQAKDINKLITYNDVSRILQGIKNAGADLNSAKIVGLNRLKGFTLKSENEDFDEDYMKQKPIEIRNILDGFMKVSIWYADK